MPISKRREPISSWQHLAPGFLATLVPADPPQDPRRLSWPFSPTSEWGKVMAEMRRADGDSGPVLY